MGLRAMLLAGVVGLLAFTGCSSHCARSIGRPAPPAKLCNGSRLANEFAWFYADIQDVIFGVNYDHDMQGEFLSGLYEH